MGARSDEKTKEIVKKYKEIVKKCKKSSAPVELFHYLYFGKRPASPPFFKFNTNCTLRSWATNVLAQRATPGSVARGARDARRVTAGRETRGAWRVVRGAGCVARGA